MYASGDILCSGSSQYYAKKKTFTYYENSEQQRYEYTERLKRFPRNNRVYVDESGVNTWFQREYARATRGSIIEDTKPGIKFQRINIIGAVCNGKHSAIVYYKQATDSGLFEHWFEKFLIPVLPKGFTVILDNARFHRKDELHKLARGKVKLLFLPPYSPDYNPIEKSWANMKRFLNNNMHSFNSVESAIHYYFKIIVN